jgi:hypothetical protein
VSSYRYKPSKPAAVLGAVVGTAILVFGLVRMLDGGAARDGEGVAFLVLWCGVGVAVVASNLWAALSKNGSLGTFSRVPDDEDATPR